MAILILADSLGLLSLFYNVFNHLVNTPNSTLWVFCLPIMCMIGSTYYAVKLSVKSRSLENNSSGMQYANDYFFPAIHSYDINEMCILRI